MPKMPIDLGRSMKEMSEPMCPSKDEPHYPSLYLEWDSDYDLPDSGTMTVKFKKVSESNSKDRDGKKRQNVSLDIMSIESVKGGKPSEKKDDENPGDHLDKLKDEVEKENAEKESDEDY